MENGEAYEQLLAKYRDLELRVTKFSTIEQDLINTRDLLDQELVQYKRLTAFNSAALKLANDREFLHLLSEAIIDIFEVESSMVFLHDTLHHEETVLVTEGFLYNADQQGDVISDLLNLASRKSRGETSILVEAELKPYRQLQNVYQSYYFHFIDPDSSLNLALFGIISKGSERLYKSLQNRNQTLFEVFGQQVRAIFANRQKSKKIQQQFNNLMEAKNELNKLSLIATKTKNGVIISDDKGRIEWVNDAFTHITGYALEDVKGLKPKDFLQRGFENTEEQRLLSEALSKKENIEVKIVNYNKKGDPYYNWLEITPVFDEDGKHTNFIALQRDITAETLYQETLVRMNARFEMVAKKSNIGIWEWDMRSNEVTWNEVLMEIYGNAKTDLTKPFFEVFKEQLYFEDRERVLQELDDIQFGKTELIESEFRILVKDSQEMRILKCLTFSERDIDNKIIRMLGSASDITEAREAELRMQASKESFINQLDTLKNFYESILSHSPAQIAVLDADGRFSYFNEEFRIKNHLKGLRNATTIAELKALNPSKAEYLQRLQVQMTKAIESNELVQFEDVMVRRGIEEFELISILPGINNLNRNANNIIITATDITDLKKYQNTLLTKNEELKKINSELDNFVYSVSHDLRSPLLSITGLIRLIKDTPDLSDLVLQYLGFAESSVVKLDNTISDILEYSRNSRLGIKSEYLDLKKMSDSIFEDLRFSAETEVVLNYQENIETPFYSDSTRINAVLKNTIGNAVKYRKKDIPNPEVYMTIDVNLERLHLIIKDNGEGIPEKSLPKVFDMFYRASGSSNGTGLGLYICKEIINKLGGEISIESHLGIGTTVSIILPNLIENRNNE